MSYVELLLNDLLVIGVWVFPYSKTWAWITRGKRDE